MKPQVGHIFLQYDIPNATLQNSQIKSDSSFDMLLLSLPINVKSSTPVPSFIYSSSMFFLFILYYYNRLSILSLLATTEESQPQPQTQTQTEEEEESYYQPLYTNSYDLCADILKDIQSLKHVSEKSNRVIDAILLHDGLNVEYAKSNGCVG